MCQRYPNRRPSDYIEELDEVQAFELDSSLAFKYWLMERDAEIARHDDIVQYLWAFVQSQSKSKITQPKRNKQLLRSNEEIQRMLSGKEPELPDIDEIRAALIGEGTVVVRH